MALENIQELRIRRRKPLRLFVLGGTDDVSFAGYKIYMISVPVGSSIDTQRYQRKFLGDILVNTDVCYSGTPVVLGAPSGLAVRSTYNASYMYPFSYYEWDSSTDHYLFVAAFDKSGNVSTVSGHALNPLPSQENWGMRGNGSTTYGEIEHSGIFNPLIYSGSISAWIRASGFTSEGFAIISKTGGTGATNYPGPFDYRIANTGIVTFVHGNGVVGAQGASHAFSYGTTVLASGITYHLGISWRQVNASTYQIRHYVNGQLTNSGTLIHTDPGADVGQSMRIGRRKDGYAAPFGILDDILLYTRILSDSEFSGIYAQRISQDFYSINSTGLVGEWSFDEGFGNWAFDDSGNNGHTHLYNHTWVSGLTIQNNPKNYLLSTSGLTFSTREKKINVEALENAGVINTNKVVEDSINTAAVTNVKIGPYAVSRDQVQWPTMNPSPNMMPYAYSTFIAKKQPYIISAVNDPLTFLGYEQGMNGLESAARIKLNISSLDGYIYLSDSDTIYNVAYNGNIAVQTLIFSFWYKVDVDPQAHDVTAQFSSSTETKVTIKAIPVDSNAGYWNKFEYPFTPGDTAVNSLNFSIYVNKPTVAANLWLDNFQVEYDDTGFGVPSQWHAGENWISGIQSNFIQPDAVQSIHISGGAVTSTKIATGAIDNSKINSSKLTYAVLSGIQETRPVAYGFELSATGLNITGVSQDPVWGSRSVAGVTLYTFSFWVHPDRDTKLFFYYHAKISGLNQASGYISLDVLSDGVIPGGSEASIVSQQRTITSSGYVFYSGVHNYSSLASGLYQGRLTLSVNHASNTVLIKRPVVEVDAR